MIINNLKLKFLLLIVSGLCIFFSFGGGKMDFYSIVLNSLSYFPVLIIFLCILISNIIDVIKDLNTNYLYLCRFKSLNEYYKKIIIDSLKANLFMTCLLLLLIIGVSLISCYLNFSIPHLELYNIPFILILIYYIIKFIVIVNLLALFSIPFYTLFSKTGVFTFLIIILICLLNSSYKEGVIISSIKDYQINFVNYLSLEAYASFMHDIIAFGLYVSILLFLLYLTVNFASQKRGDL